MLSITSLTLSSILLGAITQTVAADFSGDFNITQSDLYPENLDYDSQHGKLYLGATFNASVSVYDVTTKSLEFLTYDGITGNSSYHISGIDYDAQTGFIYFAANAAEPFLSQGANLTGTNNLIKYDTNTSTTVFVKSLDDFQVEALNITGHVVNGFQDIAQDDQGNAYYLATYGPAIAKFSPEGDTSVFFAPTDTNNSLATYGGLVWADNKLILHDDTEQSLVYIPTNSINSTVEAVKIPTANLPTVNSTITCDGVYTPPKYNNTIFLCSDDGLNAIRVFQSTDSWETATYLGDIVNPVTDGGPLPTATVQIDQSVYMNEAFFFDTAGNRTVFPFSDFTASLEALFV